VSISSQITKYNIGDVLYRINKRNVIRALTESDFFLIEEPISQRSEIDKKLTLLLDRLIKTMADHESDDLSSQDMIGEIIDYSQIGLSDLYFYFDENRVAWKGVLFKRIGNDCKLIKVTT
jgi:hypothetical protein